jgi:hypothetical protein
MIGIQVNVYRCIPPDETQKSGKEEPAEKEEKSQRNGRRRRRNRPPLLDPTLIRDSVPLPDMTPCKKSREPA